MDFPGRQPDKRMRVALTANHALFMMGDLGCVAITPQDCDTTPDHTHESCCIMQPTE